MLAETEKLESAVYWYCFINHYSYYAYRDMRETLYLRHCKCGVHKVFSRCTQRYTQTHMGAAGATLVKVVAAGLSKSCVLSLPADRAVLAHAGSIDRALVPTRQRKVLLVDGKLIGTADDVPRHGNVPGAGKGVGHALRPRNTAMMSRHATPGVNGASCI